MSITQAQYERCISKALQDPSGCWVWQGAATNKGYGHIKVGSKYWLAHRFVYTYHYGPIPDNRVIRHTCDNTNCINPEHLLVGTPQENVCDQIERGRLKPRYGKCKPVEYYRNRYDRYR